MKTISNNLKLVKNFSTPPNEAFKACKLFENVIRQQKNQTQTNIKEKKFEKRVSNR